MKFFIIAICAVILVFTIYNFVMIFKDLKQRRINKKKERDNK